jgi:hypothetical protein
MGNVFAPLRAMPKQMAETQLNMQLKMREMQMATMIAQARDTFKFVAAFTGTVAAMGTLAFLRTGAKTGFIPLLPLSFVSAYHYDLAYGNKIERIRMDAEIILLQERHALRGKLAPPAHNLLITPYDYSKLFHIGSANFEDITSPTAPSADVPTRQQ